MIMRDAGMRNTLPRRAICRVLAESDDSFVTAASILERVSETVGEIDSSTVYRMLNQLEELGFLHYIQLGSQSGAWHLTLSREHQHMICEVCGRTLTVPLEELESAFKSLVDNYDFHVSIHHFVILGHCGNCVPESRSAKRALSEE